MLTSQNIVYLVTCNVNGKKYVGQTQRSLEIRWREHLACARNGKLYHLASSIRKYGAENFYVEVLEMCETPTKMFEREEYWINELKTIKNGYNKSPGKIGNPIHVVSESTREKLSKIHKGKTLSEETKRKISETKKLKPTQFTQEYRDKARIRASGRRHTVESRQKMSKAQKGRIVSDETRQKLSEASKGQTRAAGHVCTPEMRLRMSIAHIGKMQSKETKLKMSVAVVQCDVDWNILAIYESQVLAAQLNDIKSPVGISRCCNGKSSYCNMCKWRYATDEDIEFAKINNKFNIVPDEIQIIKYKRKSSKRNLNTVLMVQSSS